MRTIAFMNQKGGVGKSTSVVNLGAALAEKKQRVLVVDLDPQASASQWLGVPGDGKALLEALSGNGRFADIICNTSIAGVDLIPSGPWLVGVEKAMAREPGAELVLRRRLQKLGTDRYDLALLDCPPSLGLLSISALAAAEEVVIPVEASTMVLLGLAELLRTVEVVRDRLNDKLRVLGILVCRVDARTRIGPEIEEHLRERFPDLVFKRSIRECTASKEAPSYGKSLLEYRGGTSAGEDYRQVAIEIMKRRTS